MDSEDIKNRFRYHPPTSDRAYKHAAVRSQVESLANVLNVEVPEGREKSLVMTHLEEVMFWSNAAIARSKEEESA